MMCLVNSYNEEKLDFTTTHLLPRPCARLLANEDMLLLSSTYTTSYPSRSRWMDLHQWIRQCRSSSSNIIVRLLEEAKSQAQTKRCSCEHWSTHIARLLHETKLLCEPTIFFYCWFTGLPWFALLVHWATVVRTAGSLGYRGSHSSDLSSTTSVPKYNS